jgi:hypothetical protein
VSLSLTVWKKTIGKVAYNYMNKPKKYDGVNGMGRSEQTIIFHL